MDSGRTVGRFFGQNLLSLTPFCSCFLYRCLSGHTTLLPFVNVFCVPLLSFEGTHRHRDRTLVLSNVFEPIRRCWKCQPGVPFTCGHNSCLPQQIEYSRVRLAAFRYRWLIASITIYDE